MFALIKSEYLKVEKIKQEIYAALTTDVNNIVNASLVIINFISSIILVITCFVYLGFLSLTLFSISILCIAIGVFIHLKSIKNTNNQFLRVRNIEQDFMKGFNSILEGNKEIKINPNKGESLFQSIILPVIIEGKNRNINAYIGYLNSQLLSQLLFYCIIVIILVVIGSYFTIELGKIISFVFALLYLLGPIVNIMLNIPILNRALISYNKLNFIKKRLEFSEETSDEKTTILNPEESFQTITFQGYKYSYPDNSFSIGPINLTIKANEIIFIYGGNGSGKTTFINTILTLYAPEEGTLTINNKKIQEYELKQTRKLFVPVFSDFYLFEDFYGIESIDEERVQKLLELFEIEHKVTFKNGKLSTTDLSTGQRKRVALISAILEDRPILVLDEWAADQDPYFRKKFYTQIIHKIVNEENKTIIAITHDDNYYQEADKLFRMNYGKLEEINSLL
ncbi:MAG: cyclic peptide export ABC transporter [Flavobacteriaceae bacterium]|nr:cyclic peptide export ABC transporter [Flavobacteriaceae bacterium]